MTLSYDIDLRLRTTDKQKHLSSQALSSLLHQILSNTISTFDISVNIFSHFLFSWRWCEISGFVDTQQISHKVVGLCKMRKTQSVKVE